MSEQKPIDFKPLDDLVKRIESTQRGLSLKIPSIEDWSKNLEARLKDNPEPQLIRNILPYQYGEYVIVSGWTGRGKTNILLNLAFGLAAGTPFLEQFDCEKCTVAFIALEGDEQNLNERYMELKEHYPPLEGRLRFKKLYPETPGKVLSEIESIVQGCRVLLIDGARYIVPGDYLKPKVCLDFVVNIRNMMRKYRMSGIFSFQVKKPSDHLLVGIPDVYSVKNATELVDDATTVMLIEKTRKSTSEDDKTLYFGKNRIARVEMDEIKLRFDKDTCLFHPINKN